MNHPGSPYRLGRKRPLVDRRTLKLTDFLRTPLPPAPPTLDLSQGITDWKMYANNVYGDCTCAALAHCHMVWSRLGGSPVDFTDADVLDLYGRVNGGHDDGAVELFVLREARTNGLAGRKLHAYVQGDTSDVAQLKAATAEFGGQYIGVSLPITAQSQPVWEDTGGTDPASQPGSWGGHAVNVIGYTLDTAGRLVWQVVTWGRVVIMTETFRQRYQEEAWFCIPENYNGSTLDWTKLDSALAQVGQVDP